MGKLYKTRKLTVKQKNGPKKIKSYEVNSNTPSTNRPPNFKLGDMILTAAVMWAGYYFIFSHMFWG